MVFGPFPPITKPYTLYLSDVEPFWPYSLPHAHNIIEPVPEWPSKKESRIIVDSKNLVEPLERR